MNYRNIIMVALAALVTACATPPTKSLENAKPLQEPAESSEIKAKATTSSTSDQSNSISGNSSPDTKTAEVEKQNNPKPVIACGKEDYRRFFEDFVRGKDYQGNEEIRYTFTAPYVQVRDYQDPSKLLETMSRRNDEFSISLRDFRWVQLVPANAYTPYTRLKIDISRVDDKTFRVDYIKAQYSNNDKDQEDRLVKTYGEPNAYIFEHRNGCWNLTQKLQSSSRSQIRTKTESQIAIEAILKKQMIYDDLRTALLKNGWVQVINDCKSNVGSRDDNCRKTPACSGDGYCVMHFVYKTDNLRLSIYTYGRVPYVTQWEFSNFKTSEGL